MEPDLTCTCGAETWEVHEEMRVGLGAARSSRGVHRPAARVTTTVVRCTECRQAMADVLDQIGEV